MSKGLVPAVARAFTAAGQRQARRCPLKLGVNGPSAGEKPWDKPPPYDETRYPNGLPGGVPAEVFTKEQAAEAITRATQFLVDAGEHSASFRRHLKWPRTSDKAMALQ